MRAPGGYEDRMNAGGEDETGRTFDGGYHDYQ